MPALTTTVACLGWNWYHAALSTSAVKKLPKVPKSTEIQGNESRLTKSRSAKTYRWNGAPRE